MTHNQHPTPVPTPAPTPVRPERVLIRKTNGKFEKKVLITKDKDLVVQPRKKNGRNRGI